MQQNLWGKIKRKWSHLHMEITLRTKRSDNKLVVSKLVSQDPLFNETYFAYSSSQELL